MTFKLNLSEKTGKTWKVEIEGLEFIDKILGEVVPGNIISADLEGYEFEITGASDKSGFTVMKQVEGIGRKKLLLTYGKGMKKKPRKEGKKKSSNPTPKGLKLRKTVRGNMISEEITQINLKVVKQGAKTLTEIYAPAVEAAPEAN
ncbi:MAG: 30S ribosomal protein S6e [Nanoarchaeota archaeon]|jgi:small subunit ribosomal protein S6e|nr:30S ribosomal protein S6e [Nanoarchaeota archaeon]